MCGRCLSEGRFIHEDKPTGNEDNQQQDELKIYPGYCSLNPRYAAQQQIIRKKPRKEKGEDKTISSAMSSTEHYSQAGQLPFSNNSKELSVTEEELKQATSVRKLYNISNLHVIALDADLASSNRLLHWAHSLLGENSTVVTVSSPSSDNIWTGETINESIHQFVMNSCTLNELTGEPTKGNSSLAIKFISLSKEISSRYSVHHVQQLQRMSNSILVESVFLRDRPNADGEIGFIFSTIWNWLRSFVGTRKNSAISFSESNEKSVLLVISQQNLQIKKDSLDCIGRLRERLLHVLFSYFHLDETFIISGTLNVLTAHFNSNRIFIR